MKSIYRIGTSSGLNPAQSVLLLEVSELHCCFAVLDFANQMLVHACFYSSEENDHTDLLRLVVDEHEELRQQFRQIAVSYYAPEHVFVPQRFYHFESAGDLLASMYQEVQKVVLSEAVAEWQLNNVYYVPSVTHKTLSRRFATGNFWHTHSIQLKSALGDSSEGAIFIDFKPRNFSVLVAKNNRLLLANMYPYVKPADVLYWLLRVCREYDLPREKVAVSIAGLIERQSAIFKELYQYFANVIFENPEGDIRLTGDFSEYPPHFFSNFHKLAACVS
ncbi:MAG TPA: DUF3822 family protein [Chitinophagaceae bacterium]